MNDKVTVEGIDISITNAEKLLWPKLGIRKVDYIKTLIQLSNYILPYTSHRLLTAIRYPHGIEGEFFYQKNAPKYTPQWVSTKAHKDNNYIVLDSLPILIWLGNQAVIEFHTEFNPYTKPRPDSLVFDLDPSKGQTFEQVVEAALLIHETLIGLDITSLIKTSGATGLQIYIPVGGIYDYDTARKINAFFGQYFADKYPHIFTIERMVDKRGKKLYFDYLQMWETKTIIVPYSPRATPQANVSTPLEWEEVGTGIVPENFTLLNINKRLEEKGDLFKSTLDKADQTTAEALNSILNHIN